MSFDSKYCEERNYYAGGYFVGGLVGLSIAGCIALIAAKIAM